MATLKGDTTNMKRKEFLISATTMFGAAMLPLAAAQGAESAAKGKERHPAIHGAIRALEKAKEELHHAAHDFGGHRVAAIEAIDRAIAQLKKALEFDRK